MKKGKPLLVRCPWCGRETKLEGNPYRPFCSRRCKLIDLGKWINQEYIIPPQDDETENKVEPDTN